DRRHQSCAGFGEGDEVACVIPSRVDGEESAACLRRGSLALFGARDDTARLVDQFAVAGIQRLEAWPALRENALEVRTDHALVSIFEFGMKIEDRFARALHEALGLAVRHRHVTADQLV